VEEVRRGIIQALYNHPQLEVLQALLPYLQAGDKHTRYAAFHTVGHLAVFTRRDAKKEEQLGQPFKQAVVELIEAMKDHEALPYAVHALRQFRADAAPAVPALLMALDDPRNQHKDSIHHPRVWIVQAFRDIGPGAKAATRALAMRLLTDPDWSVRQYAAQALGNIGADPREAGPALNQALKDKMVQVRNEAAPALARIGAVDELLDGLNDDHSETRSSVIHALATMKDKAKQIAPALVKVLRADADAKNRRNAAYALGSLGSADGVPALGQALKDADAEVRAGAVESLRTLGRAARDAAPMLFELVKTDKTEKNREKACWALVAIDIQGQKSFVPALIEMLADKNPDVTLPAILLLGQLGPDARAARDRLRAIAANQKSHPADAAREALRKIENP
jgi:HEAT repeat protein